MLKPYWKIEKPDMHDMEEREMALFGMSLHDQREGLREVLDDLGLTNVGAVADIDHGVCAVSDGDIVVDDGWRRRRPCGGHRLSGPRDRWSDMHDMRIIERDSEMYIDAHIRHKVKWRSNGTEW